MHNLQPVPNIEHTQGMYSTTHVPTASHTVQGRKYAPTSGKKNTQNEFPNLIPPCSNIGQLLGSTNGAKPNLTTNITNTGQREQDLIMHSHLPSHITTHHVSHHHFPATYFTDSVASQRSLMMRNLHARNSNGEDLCLKEKECIPIGINSITRLDTNNGGEIKQPNEQQ